MRVQEKFRTILIEDISHMIVTQLDHHIYLLSKRYNNILITASLTITSRVHDNLHIEVVDWASYIGIASNPENLTNSVEYVVNYGMKMSEYDAQHYFPTLFELGLFYRD